MANKVIKRAKELFKAARGPKMKKALKTTGRVIETASRVAVVAAVAAGAAGVAAGKAAMKNGAAAVKNNRRTRTKKSAARQTA